MTTKVYKTFYQITKLFTRFLDKQNRKLISIVLTLIFRKNVNFFCFVDIISTSENNCSYSDKLSNINKKKSLE